MQNDRIRAIGLLVRNDCNAGDTCLIGTLVLLSNALLQKCATQFHMKNVTIALDDEVHRQASIRAAELGTSLSALVKGYLIGLTGDQGPAGDQEMAADGVREVTMPFKPAPIPAPIPVNGQAAADGPPWLVGGKWVYTKDGKPRQPGAMREQLKDLPDDWDQWSPEMLEFFEKLQTEPWDDNYDDALPFDESQLLGQ